MSDDWQPPGRFDGLGCGVLVAFCLLVDALAVVGVVLLVRLF